MKAKNFVERIKKINNIKRNIEPEVLFQDCLYELIYIYKNILKLNFSEKTDYGLYIIVYNSFLKNYGLDDDEKQKFLKFNDLIFVKNESRNNDYKIRNFRKIYEGYPLNNKN